jgi:hypothetical protein
MFEVQSGREVSDASSPIRRGESEESSRCIDKEDCEHSVRSESHKENGENCEP